ncbi:acyl carrier protein [Streptomyces sp. DvalAA-14]|uniref:acyl carrier protein n=1 Tax=unclassified Streptomyces TaxID=2593676 RepID=UPI00081B0CC9|nr:MULTISPECIES: acyl carrier protein [unclassified Streptomyces]MYS21748.1 acyl carrier protein [Streptomyces sp. SID4948]SCE00437.1 acyl carrier protein [Streptomyces sp. DvalAA-14]
MPATQPDHAEMTRVVKKTAAAASQPPFDPAALSDDEALNGDRLRINSLSLVGLLVDVEEELGATFPDDLFVGRSFATIADLVAVVEQGCEAVA